MAGSGFSDYVPEEKFLGPPSPKNLATPLLNQPKPIHAEELVKSGKLTITLIARQKM